MNEREKPETICVRCNLRKALEFAAEQSITIQVLVDMGIDKVLDELAEGGGRSSDPQLRNLLYILGLADESEEHQAASNDRLEFWRWKASVLQKLFGHPALGPDSTCAVELPFDAWDWEANFLSGKTANDLYDEADAVFNIHGW